MTIRYQRVPVAQIDIADAADVYEQSGLGVRRPMDDERRFKAMMRHANLIVAAYDGTRMVGIVRCLTDDCYVTYVSDLAVSFEYQRQGVGRGLLDEVARQIPGVKMVLLAAPDAREYYGKVGFEQHPSAWVREAAEPWEREKDVVHTIVVTQTDLAEDE